MAVKGFTQADSKTGTSKKKTTASSSRPSFTSTGKAGGMRYGDTATSAVPKKQTGTGITATPQVQSPYVPASPGLGAGGAPNQYGVPSGNVQAQVQSPGIGAGGNYAAGSPGTNVGNVSSGDPMTGAGAGYGYTPQGLGMLYQNPVPLAQDVLGGAGIDNYGMALALSDAMNPALYAYMMQTKGMGDQSDAATIDFISNYMDQMVTPGGSMPNMADLMTNVLGAGDVNSSPLAMMLSGIPPEDQVKVLANFLAAAGYGNNPLAQRAYGNAADYYGNEYLGGVMKGDPGASNYASYLQGGPLAKWMGVR